MNKHTDSQLHNDCFVKGARHHFFSTVTFEIPTVSLQIAPVIYEETWTAECHYLVVQNNMILYT